LQVVDRIAVLRQVRSSRSGTVGLVPTMGALHAGHLALVAAAREMTDVVIATIFVNPTQFTANEDLAMYPRRLQADLDLFEQVGVDVVFTPTVELMYPPGFQTWVEVTEVSGRLEGERRPGHFRGVATVVNKLFNLTQPTHAFFGQKDAQQVAVIKQMTRDLNLPIAIIVCPTLREANGLAMSSRNAYLSVEQREQAAVIYRALQQSARLYEQGNRDPAVLRQAILHEIDTVPEAQVDYVDVADAISLREVSEAIETPLLLSTVVKMGTTRLLDNIVLPMHLNTRTDLTRVLGGDGMQ
jgi:pantoate--beta-alanine ligase